MSDVRRSLRSTIIGVTANATLVVIKLITGLAGNSYALIADAVESALDVVGSFIVYGGIAIAARPPDEDHPYGHGKAESIAAMGIAVLLLGAAIALAIESVREILTPHHAPEWYTLVVLVAVIIAKEWLYRFVVNVGEELGSTVVKSDAWHHRSDAITSAAAFIGISIALIAGPGYESADDWAALVACGIIALNGIRILRTGIAEVMDTVPSGDIEQQVRAVASRVDSVKGLEKCRLRKYGVKWVVDLHVVVDKDLTVERGHEIAHRVKDTLMSSSIAIADVLIHIEPG